MKIFIIESIGVGWMFKRDGEYYEEVWSRLSFITYGKKYRGIHVSEIRRS